MNSIAQIFEKSLLEALGWTLVHSIWQISIVAILIALLLVFLHRKKAALRYVVVSSGLATILLLSVYTFQKYYDPVVPVLQTSSNIPDSSIESSKKAGNYKEVQSSQPVHKETIELFRRYFDRNLPIIVSIWFLCIVILTIRYLGSLAWMHRIKSLARPIDEKFQQLVFSLSLKMKINRIVRVAETIRINSPGVIGHFKPVILLPVQFFSGLSEKEIEAILLHELAHVKRNDFLVNIIQSFLEILFFFHPAIWWLSANLKSERENACDDLAVECGADNYVLAKTLSFVTEQSIQDNMAMAFSGKKNKTKHRIQRLILTNNMKTNLKTKLLSALVLIAVIATMSFSLRDGTGIENEILNITSEEVDKSTENKLNNKSGEPANEVQEAVPQDLLSESDKISEEDDEEDAVFFKSLMKQGSKKWNAYRNGHSEIDFETVLKESDLSNFDLKKFNLSNVNLKEATLNGTDFSEANLSDVNLKEAVLAGAKFVKANMQGVDLKETVLSNCNFSGANLRGANMKETDFQNADFSKADLRGVDMHEALTAQANFKGAIMDHTTLLPPKFDLKKMGVIVK